MTEKEKTPTSPDDDGHAGTMDRTRTALFRMGEMNNENAVPGTPAERISLVWPLTCEVASLSGLYDVEQRLQRHITVVRRRTG